MSPAQSTSLSSRESPASLGGFHLDELRLVVGSGGLYALRMLGVYMATPLLSPYAESLPGSTPVWIGLSLGAYGLTQAIFQIPFGILGDRLGRLRSLMLGLGVFAVGSFVCALASTAPVLVLGRLIQGIGAMASTMIALMGDYTRDEVRTRAMAIMGIMIGSSFALGLVFGPVVAASKSVAWLFGLSGVLSVVGVLLLPFIIRGVGRNAHPEAHTLPALPVREAVRILSKRQLLSLDFGILVLHLGLTAIFVLLPLRLVELVEPSQQWKIYAPVIGLGFAALGISSHFAEKARGARIVLAIGCLSIATGFTLFATGHGLLIMIASLAFYVVGFASMEPVLSAQVTHHAHSLVRGTAAGVFNTVQFFGVFLGGLLAGLALKLHMESVFFITIAATQLPWLLIAWRIPKVQPEESDV